MNMDKITDIEKKILEGSKSRYGYIAGPREAKAVQRLLNRGAPIVVDTDGKYINVYHTDLDYK